MTTKNLLTSLLVLLAVAVVSCQKEPSTSGLHEDYLVYTDYDQQADFSDVETFYLPDSILVIGNADKTEYWKDADAMAIIGITILSQREGLGFEAQVQSDTAPLNGITEALLSALGERVHVLRDPTRGGLATTLNEIAAQSQVSIEIDEEAVPIHPAVASACEFLGLDPLYIANEGKLIVIVEENASQEALSIIRACKYGENAAVIGHVTAEQPGLVSMRTAIGGKRLVDWLNSDPLPRIC